MKDNNPRKNAFDKKRKYRQLNKLQSIIKIKFKDKSLLNRALTHRSYINESSGAGDDNERLEYLGDSVLGLVVNEYLYKHYEDYSEGSLAKIKSAAVSEATLSQIARAIHLGAYINMGKGEELSGGRNRDSILTNAFEALIGAVYLDSGLKQARKFVLSVLKNDIFRIDKLSYLRDPKTTLQEYVQKKYKDRPEYRVLQEDGPDHEKEFCVCIIINGVQITTARGSSKQKAEMIAAREVLKKIEQGEKV